MPIFFQHQVDENTRLGIWKIEEDVSFFDVPLQREIKHINKKLQHLAGRFLLRYLFDDFPLQLIQIADTRKPFLQSEAFHFSISHCGDYAAAIVSRDKRVGIDIEIPTEKVQRIKHKFLHSDEFDLFNSTVQDEDSNLQTENLTLLWSCKEAVFKWWS
ncbi:MAG TPA: 4'-phosphopantetheinyl transferase superfamily protein, partial [Flavisolibacter sp.]|nr:4'-phosphopantetheinyl transferase superfamily protein [Flavisolibacter sp.]